MRLTTMLLWYFCLSISLTAFPITPASGSPTASAPSDRASATVTHFVLVDADTDHDIGPIRDGQTISLEELPTDNLNIRADTDPATVGSVAFELDGAEIRIENAAPYALAGDTEGDYKVWQPASGRHTLTATPYAQPDGGGRSGNPMTVTFSIVGGDGSTDNVGSDDNVGGGSRSAVTHFVLVNADTDHDIGPIRDGQTISLEELPTHNVNIRADTDPATVGSVAFELNGAEIRIENTAPYAFSGDTEGDYKVWQPASGRHTLTATPYAQPDGGGRSGNPMTVTFSIVGSATDDGGTDGGGTDDGSTDDGGSDDHVGDGASSSVTHFVLVNADTDHEIGPIRDGQTVTLEELPTHNLNIRADTDPATVGSVAFELDGDEIRIENAAPYALAGDTEGDYKSWRPESGRHTLTATPSAQPDGGGNSGNPLTVTFSIVGSMEDGGTDDGGTDDGSTDDGGTDDGGTDDGGTDDGSTDDGGTDIGGTDDGGTDDGGTDDGGTDDGGTDDGGTDDGGTDDGGTDDGGTDDGGTDDGGTDDGGTDDGGTDDGGTDDGSTDDGGTDDGGTDDGSTDDGGTDDGGTDDGGTDDGGTDDGGTRDGITDEGDGTWECSSNCSHDLTINGEISRYHPIVLTFDGPSAGETGNPHAFLDYRLNVTFRHAASGAAYTVPGYFAADGNAAQTGATDGSKWRVHFTPDKLGEWSFVASFRTGDNVAISSDPQAGAPTSFDGISGTFSVSETDKSGRDHRGKGILRYVDEHYLQFDNGEYFLKAGANSPENFLGYEDFDGTSDENGSFLHAYGPHVSDWKTGDPTWRSGKGKGIIGALNYLASEQMNVVYFLTMNVFGDGYDVWPWIDPTRRDRFDVSKLAQWEIVFSHMDRKGIMLHVVMQETENDQLLDGGELGPERKLYLRELVARFSHHLALVWNLGEENSNTDAQRKAFADYIRGLDPYNHPIKVHTRPAEKEEIFEPLLGYDAFEGPSVQTHMEAYEDVKQWVESSASTDRPWVVTLDEPGQAKKGVTPDGPGNNHAEARMDALWPTLMAGGAGVEWYFGYDYDHDDLTCEDWRSRDAMWAYTRHAISFFQDLPFWKMEPQRNLTSATNDYVFAATNEVIAIYFPDASSLGTLDLTTYSGTYEVEWYNPRTGAHSSANSIAGGSILQLPKPPADPGLDWALLLRNSQASASMSKRASEALTGDVQVETYELLQNYPNPFNASTVVEFSLPETAHTTLVLYDVIGRKVAELVNEVRSAGTYRVHWDADDLPSGAYFYRLESGSFTESRRMLLVK